MTMPGPNEYVGISFCSPHHWPTPCPVCTSGSYPVPTSPMHSPAGTGWGRPIRSPKYGYDFLPEDCRHCWCQRPQEGAVDYTIREGHERCCNCGIQRLMPPS